MTFLEQCFDGLLSLISWLAFLLSIPIFLLGCFVGWLAAVGWAGYHFGVSLYIRDEF